MGELMTHVMNSGFPLRESAIIHLFVGGSQLHGAKVQGYDDLDIYGAYIEPPQRILGLMELPHFVWSSGSDKAKNTANDVDVTMYSLRRWAELMLKGNPSILHYLYSQNVATSASVWNEFIVPRKDRFVSKMSAQQYIGFANSQRMRLTGERGMGRHGQRTDLVEKYGFDTKFAMHYIRLLCECRELLTDHRLTLPLREREHLVEIRTGKYKQDDVLAEGTELQCECEVLLAKSTLPERPDVAELSEIVAHAYRAHWETNSD